MKIAILGFAGSGKSTLAQTLGEITGAPVLHLDTVQFLPDWEVRDETEKRRMVEDFLDSHLSWIIDGNYRKLSFERRLAEADQIWILLFDRIPRFARVCRRYRQYRGISRPDMAEGCREKLDGEFIRWVLWKGCTPEIDERMRDVVRQYPEKSHLLENQRQVNTALRLFREGRL